MPEPEPEPVVLVLSGWWRRVGAFVLDWTILLVVGGWVVSTEVPLNSEATMFLLLPFLYFTGMHAAWGRTIGKFASGIVVLRENGDGLSPGVAVGRSAIQVVLAVIPFGFFADSLWPLWNRTHQALHDKAAGTIVVRVR